MELKVYRHRTQKDLYLVRDWTTIVGNENTAFYLTTSDIFWALKDASKDNFLEWYTRFPNLTVETTYTMHTEVDGFKGILTKKVRYPVREFEPVVFVEKEEH